MKTKHTNVTFSLLLISASLLSAQSLLSSGAIGTSPLSAESPAATATTTDSSEYADGIRAIHESRWNDAIQIFTHIIDTNGASADAALYWKAYSLNKLGKPTDSTELCSRLKQDFTISRWNEECEALEIEIKVKNGSSVDANGTHSDDTLLLSLNSMMNKNKKEALEQLDEILNSDAPGYLKNEAVFVLRSNHAQTINAQIVRIRSVEGDVRIHRSDEKKAAIWEEAVSGLPLLTGDSLVTVDGRAEIEFEDASMVYLDANSILLFNEISTVDGSPRTDLSLLAGTASFRLNPTVTDETYTVHSPTDNFHARFPHTINMRLSSYSDAVAVKFLLAGLDPFANSNHDANSQPNTTHYVREGHLVKLAQADDSDRFDEWDNWVQARYDERMKTMAEVEHDSGLTEALPGLDQLAGKGEFFACVLYGTCWEPAIQTEAVQDTTNKTANGTKNAGNSKPVQSYFDYFPCVYPYAYRWQMNYYDASTQVVPWYWTVCHTGNWIYSHRRRHYVWVPGRTRHHTPPVNWVRSGKTLAYIPKHPKDYASAQPLNRHEEVFAIKGKELGPIQLEVTEPITTLSHEPREVGEPVQTHLKVATEPVMSMRSLKDSLTKAALKSNTGAIPVKFDSKHGSFLTPSTVHNGSESKTVYAPVNNRSGNLQSGTHSAGGGTTHGGYSTTGSTVTHSGGGGTTASSGSSGAHAGTSSPAPSSSAAPAPIAAGSSSGGHH